MVSIIENWASIQGIVTSVGDTPAPNGFFQVELELKKAADIEGFPNLAKADEGGIIRINVNTERITCYKIKPGSNLSARARKAFGQVYFLE